MSTKGVIGPHTFSNQSAFNNLMRTIQEQPDDNQKKLREMLEKLGNNFASHLEEAAKMCINNSRLFPPDITPVVAHSGSVFRADAANIRTKYDSTVQTASKLHASIRSSQTEGRFVLRAVEQLTDSDANSVKAAVRKLLEECNRNAEHMLKIIREHLPDPAAARKSRTGNRRSHSSYARPGVALRPTSGVQQRQRPFEGPGSKKPFVPETITAEARNSKTRMSSSSRKTSTTKKTLDPKTSDKK